MGDQPVALDQPEFSFNSATLLELLLHERTSVHEMLALQNFLTGFFLERLSRSGYKIMLTRERRPRKHEPGK